MAPRCVSNSRSIGRSAFAVALAAALGGCGPSRTSDETSGGNSALGGTVGTGGSITTGGLPASSGGTSAAGGANSGGKSAAGGASSAGGSGGATGQTGGTSAGGASGGASPKGGTSNGGGGLGGGTAGGATGSGGASSGECTRALLDTLTDDYFKALSAGDPSTLPLATNVKFTENAQKSELGKGLSIHQAVNKVMSDPANADLVARHKSEQLKKMGAIAA